MDSAIVDSLQTFFRWTSLRVFAINFSNFAMSQNVHFVHLCLVWLFTWVDFEKYLEGMILSFDYSL